MTKFLVVVLVHEADNVVEEKDALDGRAHRVALRLEPVDDEAGAEVEQLVDPFRLLHDVDHEVAGVAREPSRAHRAARGRHREDFAGIQNLLALHPQAVERQRHEGVGLDFVLGQLVYVLDVEEHVVLARRVVLPKFDLGAEHRRLRGHAVLQPPAGNENDVRKLAMDLQVGLKPHLWIEEEVHVLDANIARNPRAVDDQGHRHLIEFLAAGGFLERVPLGGRHGESGKG
jgi:hypothetical protein